MKTGKFSNFTLEIFCRNLYEGFHFLTEQSPIIFKENEFRSNARRIYCIWRVHHGKHNEFRFKWKSRQLDGQSSKVMDIWRTDIQEVPVLKLLPVWNISYHGTENSVKNELNKKTRSTQEKNYLKQKFNYFFPVLFHFLVLSSYNL